ncbi:efflux RND transporter permease subunit [Methylosinus sp. LW4]|uniref:efflux RND transporter permease subunit n=1 Tax=Methylosinus sp. LW4 TaxID=136993 RepID=UPI0003A039B8|nr:efflux RND transporter permease subunit [Methylosinus sp. LW4]
MAFSTVFITRPIATTLLMLGLSLMGVVSYALLPIAGVPQVDIPTIKVSAQLAGASAETMATAVTAPLERQLSVVPGMTTMSSSSSLGHTAIQVEFDLSRSVDAAAQDVQSAINAALGDLPKSMTNPPIYEKTNPADALLMSIAVTSDDLPIIKVDEFAENYIAPAVSRIIGVGFVDYHGQQKRAIRIQLDPRKLAAIGLTTQDVRVAVGSATVNTPKGTLDGPKRSVTLDATDQLFSPDAVDETIIAYRSGAPVRIIDVGRAVDGVEDVRGAAWLGERQTVIIDVHKQPGFNVNETVEQIRRALPDIERRLPPSVHLQILGDRTRTIRASVADVQLTLSISVALVVLVVFLFLRHAAATLIPSVAIPVSLLCTFTAMSLFGYTLDNVSLMAMTVTIGFIIDDAIVMVENIIRHVESGESPLDAAIRGASEIGFTIVSMTLSLVAVFIPLLLMGGLIGRLFREFAMTASIAIIMSGVVSLTLTPTMCAIVLRRKPIGGTHRHSFLDQLERGFSRMQNAYAASLRWSLRERSLVMAAFAVSIILTAYLYAIVPKGFFPQQDNGLISASAEAAQDISYPSMVEHTQSLVKLILEDKDVRNVSYWLDNTNSARINIDLAPLEERDSSTTEVIARLRKKAQAVPGVALFGQARQDVQIGARVSKTQYQYTLQDPNIGELFEWAPKILEKLSALPELQDVTGDLQANAPRMVLKIDRDILGRLGITPQSLDDALYDAFGQRQIATIFSQLDQHHVVMEVEPRFQEDVSALRELYLRSPVSGQMIPLSVLTKFEPSVSPLTINHQDQFPSVTLSFNLAPGHSLGEALDAIHAMELSTPKPAALTARFQGSAQVFQSSLASQPYLIAAAIICVYLILGMLYESFVHPITIISTLPSAGAGALAALLMLGYDFSLIALIGVILLVGIVKKNAIMMIDFALHAQRIEHMAPREAIYEASVRRFRPIMMTTLAALLGALPLALGSGAGSELRRPLGIAIVGGLLISQFLTLYTTPIIYLYLGNLSERLSPLVARLRNVARTAAAERPAAE